MKAYVRMVLKKLHYPFLTFAHVVSIGSLAAVKVHVLPALHILKKFSYLPITLEKQKYYNFARRSRRVSMHFCTCVSVSMNVSLQFCSSRRNPKCGNASLLQICTIIKYEATFSIDVNFIYLKNFWINVHNNMYEYIN